MAEFLRAGFDNNEAALKDAPVALREFFRDASVPPEWLSDTDFAPLAFECFIGTRKPSLASFVSGSAHRRF